MSLKTTTVEISWQPVTDETELHSTKNIEAETRGKLRIPPIFGSTSAFNPKIILHGETITITQPSNEEHPPILSSKPLSKPAFEQELNRRKKGFQPFTYNTTSTFPNEINTRIRLTLPIRLARITFHDSRPVNPSPDIIMTITRKYRQSP
jgi:hypothetical protein